jgi:alpha-galactosidase
MALALNATKRPIYFSLCNWGNEDVTNWGYKIANSWRTTQDITVVYSPTNQF